MKRKFILFTILSAILTPTYGDEFDDVLISDSADSDVTVDDYSLNPDAAPADVGAFDIAGVMLGMQFEDVHTLFFQNGNLYAPRQKDSIVYTIAQEWKYNLDYECRQQKNYNPADLEKCINTLAKNRGLLYASEVHLERKFTGETVTIYFTSNATDNVVWRVVYTNDVNEIEGDDPKFANQREKKILKFWQDVLDKYGAPNSGTDAWLSSNNAYDPMLRAYYGELELIDNGRNAADASKNIQSARENFKPKTYSF